MKRLVFILILIVLIGCTVQVKENVKEQQGLVTPPAEQPVQEQTTAQQPVAEEVKVPENPLEAICNLLPLTDKLSPGDKWFCLAVVNHNPALCKEMTSIIEISDNGEMNDEGDEEDETNKNICFAVVNADSSYCKKLPDQHAKKTCYYQTAVMNQNIDFCDEIDYDKNERLQCYFNFVINLYWWDRSNEIKEEYCNRFPAKEPDKNTCLAFKDRDVSLCKSNVNCLTFFKQDISFCSGKGSVLKDCVRDRAMTDKDVSICETLTGAQRDDCLGDFCTHIKLDKTICDKIVDDMERQSRYSEIAIHISNNVRKD